MNALEKRNWRAVDDLDGQPRKGFVLNGDGIVCIDIDHCLDRSHRPQPWVRRLLAKVPPTWIEISPSGTGLHIWGFADYPTATMTRFGGHTVEIYGDRRFITITGNPMARCATTFADLQEVIDNLI